MPASQHGSAIKVGTTRGFNRQPKLSDEDGDPAGILRSYSSKRRVASDLGRGSSPVISSIPIRRCLASTDEGSTHAWAEVYVPGAGWITFDPTNRGVGGSNLVPVAVARNIWQAMPVRGSYSGAPDAFLGMSVQVFVTLQKSASFNPPRPPSG